MASCLNGAPPPLASRMGTNTSWNLPMTLISSPFSIKTNLTCNVAFCQCCVSLFLCTVDAGVIFVFPVWLHFGWCAVFFFISGVWLQVKFPIWDNKISESESINKLGGKKMGSHPDGYKWGQGLMTDHYFAHSFALVQPSASCGHAVLSEHTSQWVSPYYNIFSWTWQLLKARWGAVLN